MPSLACRDALSREISDPVTDPLTGLCYRNPCAAEEAGVLDWVPGCVLARPVYGSYEGGAMPVDTWASEVWWSGGHGRRRRGRRRPGSGWSRSGGSAGSGPGSSSRRPGGGIVQQPGQKLYGSQPKTGYTSSVALVRGQPDQPKYQSYTPTYTSPIARARQQLYSQTPFITARAQAAPAYSASPQQSAIVRAQARPSVQQPSYARGGTAQAAPRYSASPQTAYVAKTSVKGLGQVPAGRPPLNAAISDIVSRWMRLSLMLIAGAIIPPVLVGGIVRGRTKSWGKAIAAGAATLAVEGAALNGYQEYRRRSAPASATAPLTVPTYAFVR